MSTKILGFNPFRSLIRKKSNQLEGEFRRLSMIFVNQYNTLDKETLSHLNQEIQAVRDQLINQSNLFGR